VVQKQHTAVEIVDCRVWILKHKLDCQYLGKTYEKNLDSWKLFTFIDDASEVAPPLVPNFAVALCYHVDF